MKNAKFTLSPNQLKNLAPKTKTIFAENKTFSDVIMEGIIFAIGTATALLIATAIIIIFTNLIY